MSSFFDRIFGPRGVENQILRLDLGAEFRRLKAIARLARCRSSERALRAPPAI